MNAGIMARQAAEDKNSHGSTERDLLVVGPGVLGRLVAEKWLQVLCFKIYMQFCSVVSFLFWQIFFLLTYTAKMIYGLFHN